MRKALALLCFLLAASGVSAQAIDPVSGLTPGSTPTGCTALSLFYADSASAFACMDGTSWNNTGRALTITGATVTASTPILALTQTWNNAAVAFTGIDLNVTNTASLSSSPLINLRVGGVSQFLVSRAGSITTAGNLTVSSAFLGLTTTNSSTLTFGTVADVVLGRNSAASLRLGNPDAAAPVAQTLGVQSVVAGTTNTAGANWTHKGSLSTGSGIGGSLIFQTSAANAAATTQNAGVTLLTLMGSATTTANPGRILAAGQIESSGSQPTAAGAGGTCATGAIVGGANAGTVTLTGACAATNTITLTFLTASATGWACDATNRNTPAALVQETTTSATTAVLTVSGATGATDVIQYKCTAY